MKRASRGARYAAGLALIAACLDPSIDRRVAPPLQPAAVLVGAGDIADCALRGDEATAEILDTTPGTVFADGDNAYQDGSTQNYAQCYNPTWGRFKARTRPTPGNHEYHTPGASGYYTYFGALAGDSGLGYYSYTLGAWHIVVLNSVIGRAAGTPQELWLRADLAGHQNRCILAYWHYPRFSSGPHGDDTTMSGFWHVLYDARADVVIAGHDHIYERFAPQNPDGVLDSVNGIREFVVGTGGASHNGYSHIDANSDVRDSTSFGVIVLRLDSASYHWEFVPVSGATFHDSGTGSCH